MKKLLLFALVIALVAVLGACGGNNNETEPTNVETEATPTPTPTPEATPEPLEEIEDEQEPRVVVVPARPANVLWSLSTDYEFQHLEDGERGSDDDILHSRYWTGAGEPTFRVVESPLGGVALRLTDRMETWHAVDIILPELGMDTANYAYQLTIIGNHVGDVTVGGGDSPWANFITLPATGEFTLVEILPATIIEDAGERGHLRLAANNMEHISFYEIEIRRVSLDGEELEAEEADEPEDVEEDAEEADEPETDGTPAATVNVPARPANVVWSLATDADFQVLEVGTRGGSEDILESEYWMGSGSPTYRVVENPLGGVALQLTNREASYHAVDLVTDAMNLNTSANSYRIVIRGHLSSAGNITVGGGDSPWATFFTQSANGDFTLDDVITAATIENAGSRHHLRISADNMADITLHAIEITRVDLVVVPVVEVPAVPAGVIWSLATDGAFQSIPVGTSGGGDVLAPTPHIQDAGGPSIEIIESPAGGNGIRVSNRMYDWHTVDIMFDAMDLDLANNSYTIRVRGSVENPPAGTTIDIMGTGGAWGRLNRPGEDNEGAPLTGTTFDTSAVFNAAIMQEMAGATPGEQGRLRFAVGGEGAQSHYRIYEIVITRN